MGETGQVTGDAAEVYDERFLPAMFNEWAPRVAELAELEPGMRVLDVACGTGVLSLVVAEVVMPDGTVVGLDLNPGMLDVARRKAPRIDWREASAEAIPFEDAAFDAVVSQFGLMFVEDKARAIREMVRVLRPAGRLAIAVWDSLPNVTGYGAFTGLLSRLFGDSAAESLRAPYSLGDTQILSSLFSVTDALDITISTLEGKVRYPSIRYWMEADIRGWTLSDALDDAQLELLISEAETDLARFVNDDGAVEFSSPAHIVAGTKRAV
ncbi:MAG: methyltransferase domain-containing protein [Deltaproteobacteria bacterium]|nr:methyltransferase domain-containing protein [Deltaproteobacteria bacterium]